MGQYFQFWCDACGYDVEVSGGPDSGMAVATQTIACSKCKQLFDVVTSNEPWNASAIQEPLRCPRSRGSSHRVAAWNGGDPCPRCNAIMRPARVAAVLWD